MAANITIEKYIGYIDENGSIPFIGIGYQLGLQFTYDHASEVNTFAEVVWNGIPFRATKTETVSATVDRYQIDMTEIVRATKTIAPLTAPVTVAGLTQTATYIINGKRSNGTTHVSSSTESVVITFAKPFVGNTTNIPDIFNNGFSSPIYHNGYFCVYNNTIDSFEIIFDITQHTYINQQGEEITWLNRDGRWSFWNFRKISESRDVKKSGEVANYKLFNVDQATKTYDTTTELKVSVVFDTIAYNAEHFRQLTEIGESERVFYKNRAFRVKDWSKDSAECRQNLKFNLTLEIEENA